MNDLGITDEYSGEPVAEKPAKKSYPKLYLRKDQIEAFGLDLNNIKVGSDNEYKVEIVFRVCSVSNSEDYSSIDLEILRSGDIEPVSVEEDTEDDEELSPKQLHEEFIRKLNATTKKPKDLGIL